MSVTDSQPSGSGASVGTCFLCGAVGKLTKEHLFPEWLAAYRRNPAGGVITTGPGSKPRAAHAYSDRYRIFCKPCNNEFGSQIDERVKPVLLKMVHGFETILGMDDVRVLVPWAYLSALKVGHVASKEAVTGDLTPFARDFRATSLPPLNGCRIGTARQLLTAAPGSTIARQLTTDPDSEVVREQSVAVNRITTLQGVRVGVSIRFSCGEAMFVVQLIDPGATPPAEQSVLIRLWPFPSDS